MSFWILGVSFILFFLIVYVLLFVRSYVARIVRENQLQADLALEAQKELLRHTLFVQEEERSRISMDIHDNLLAQLNIIRMLNENEEDRTAINQRLKTSMSAARKISHDLSPPMMEELDLASLLEEYLQSLKIGIELRFYSFHSAAQIDLPQVKLHVFRIFQEVLTNCLKHANASRIEVHFRGTESLVGILIKDNGSGETIQPGQGLGMKNIESRAQFLQANYKYHSQRGKGTRFLLCFNLKTLNEWRKK